MSHIRAPTRHSHPFLQGINRHPRRRQATVPSAGNFSSGAATGVLILPGLFSGEEAYVTLSNNLSKQGFCTKIVPIKWYQWIPPFLGQDFEFYLKAADEALSSLYLENGLDWKKDKVAIVAHSAGGFLARILLGNQKYQGQVYGRANRVHTLVTLGSPHKSKEKYPFGRFPEKLWVEGEQHLPPHERCTSSLQFANKFYPDGNSFSDVRIACIAGDVTTGALCEAYRELEFSQDATPLSKRRNILARMGLALTAYESYKAGCEKANVRGDVITPIEIAHLDGAENVILHGVWHGPPFFTTKWYGTEYNQWMHYLYPPIDAKKQHTDPKANEILGRQS